MTKSPIEKEKQRAWSKWSKAQIAPTDTVCEICGVHKWIYQPRNKVWKSNRTFVCHHITYEHVGHETRADIQILCSSCHNTMHKILRMASKAEHIERLKALVKEFFIYVPGSYTESRRTKSESKECDG